MKKIYLLLIATMLLGAPICTMAQADQTIEVSMSGITLAISGNNLHVTGANGEAMEILSLTGARITTIRIDSADKSLTLNLPKGCYLLKIGKIVRKISIQ